MRIRILATLGLIAGLAAGCSSPDAHDDRVARHSASAPALATPGQRAVRFAPKRQVQGIAALPDGGQLLAYRREPERRTLAYTWHPVEMSEAHALAAIGGELVVTGPDGQPIRMRYERHVEHPDGNWTWIGRSSGNPAGEEAIITFGEKAVFGSIPYGAGPALRITTGGGRLWMMETDPRAVASLPGAHPGGTDAILPPIRNVQGRDAVRHAAGFQAVAATTAAPVVDLLIGYTSGFATRLGGQSQANTRVVNLIDIANQAYTNSQVPGRVRLVKTMQVNYPDTTSNESALYALTGCNGTACTEVDPALQPLHVAREQYGADVVSLVRNYNDPENGGCGIAWLIGGGKAAITATDEYAGMSVVSDSNGIAGGSFPDNGYVCHNETLAHELGHNMGLAHDKVTASGDDRVLQDDEYGTFAYSFGYKNSAAGFFTVMAYGDGGQHMYRVFSNPRTTYCGTFACGVVDQADNARTLQATMSSVGLFRTSRNQRLRDIDGDGRSDMLLRYYKTATNNVSYWIMNGASRSRIGYDTMGASYQLVATGDFNGDGRLDLVWSAESNRTLIMWLGTGTGFSKVSAGTYALGWSVAGAGDIDGDGKSDLLLRYYKTATNNVSYWIMNGASRSRIGYDTMAASYRLVATGDFNGDGRLDLVWTAEAKRILIMWLGTGTTFSKVSAGTYGLGWSVAGAGDIDGDRKSDLLLRYYKTATNNFSYWVMNGASRSHIGYDTMAASYHLATIGDFTGDGRLDLVWTADGNRSLIMWLKTATGFSKVPAGTYGLGWSVADPEVSRLQD